jgi:hypothetical protein
VAESRRDRAQERRGGLMELLQGEKGLLARLSGTGSANVGLPRVR